MDLLYKQYILDKNNPQEDFIGPRTQVSDAESTDNLDSNQINDCTTTSADQSTTCDREFRLGDIFSKEDNSNLDADIIYD